MLTPVLRSRSGLGFLPPEHPERLDGYAPMSFLHTGQTATPMPRMTRTQTTSTIIGAGFCLVRASEALVLLAVTLSEAAVLR